MQNPFFYHKEIPIYPDVKVSYAIGTVMFAECWVRIFRKGAYWLVRTYNKYSVSEPLDAVSCLNMFHSNCYKIVKFYRIDQNVLKTEWIEKDPNQSSEDDRLNLFLHDTEQSNRIAKKVLLDSRKIGY